MLGAFLPTRIEPGKLSGWVEIQPGITFRVQVVNGLTMVEYHAATFKASDNLRNLLRSRHIGIVPPKLSTVARLRTVQVQSCTDSMYGNESANSVHSSITVNCASGVQIQGLIDVEPAVGSGIPGSGEHGYSGTTHLGAIFTLYCQPISVSNPQCKGSFSGADLDNWTIYESWSADDGESDQAMQCGPDSSNCSQ